MSNANIISANELTLTVNFNEGTTWADLLAQQKVLDFFAPLNTADIIGLISEYNDMDAELIRDSMLDLTVEDGDTITVDAEGDASVLIGQEDAVATEDANAGFVHVTASADHFDLPIINGVSRIADIISNTVAARLGKTVDGVLNMTLQVNGVNVQTTATLNNGDELVISPNTAGTKGSSTLTIVLDDGEEFNWEQEHGEEVSISRGVVEFLREKNYQGDKELVGINAVDGADITGLNEDMYDTIVGCVADGQTVEIDANPDDFAEEEEEEEATNQIASVCIHVGSTDAEGSTVAIINGVTKLEDVALSSKILAKSAQSPEQARTLLYQVNGVEVQLDIKLHNGDDIVALPRPAGTKGLNA